ncbi:MAG: T9SS type A sorting domain-containing protein [Flavobacteriales bacterium]|nr:T9SS type A sorting domain-containing protein [Flavobacteriales bacterium]
MIDDMGNLITDVFDGSGCGAYDYVTPSLTTTYKYISGIVPAPDGSFYIHGGYHGYDDGTTNDTTQRFVSKLYGLDVGVQERAEPTVLRVFPSPSSAILNVALPISFPKESAITIFDHLGRQIARHLVFDHSGTWDLRSLEPGCYYVHASGDDELLFSKWIKQ